MNMHRPSCLVAVVLIAIQLFGPATLWALEEQRGVRIEANRRVVVSGLTGGELTATTAQRTAPVQFSEAVGFGDALRTGAGTTAEVLVNHQAVVTMLGESQVRLEQEGANTIVYLTKGDVLLSVAASRLSEGQAVIIETPTARVRTTGGVLRARVGAAPRQAGPVVPPLDARPHLVSFSAATPVATGPVGGESFEVLEGTMHVAASTPGAKPITVPAGQGIQSAGGVLGMPSPLTTGSGSPTPVLGVAQHGSTPARGLEFVAQQQMTQVGALQQALFGGADANEAEGEKTGEKNAAQGAIVATLFGTSNSGGSLSNSLFGSGSPYAAALLNATNAQGTGVGDDRSNFGINLSPFTKHVNVDVRGGAGLLLFRSGGANSVPNKELVLVDGGDPTLAPHRGIAPKDTLIVGATFSNGVPAPTNNNIKANEAIPVGEYRSGQNGSQPGPLLTDFTVTGASNVSSGTNPRYYATRPPTFPLFGTVPPSQDLAGFSLFSKDQDGAFAVQDPENTDNGIPFWNIDPIVRARSAGQFVDLKGGVVLAQSTTITIGETTATKQYFQSKSNSEYVGSLLAVLAGGTEAAFVKIQDRALGVMDGSQVNGSGSVALLAVLDSRLIGPAAGVAGRANNEIPPLLELDSSVSTKSAVTVKSAVVVRYTNASFGALDGALLEASSPILAITNGTMTTTGHFADFSTNGKVALNATVVPGDALVRLNQGSLTVNGNLFTLNNAKANVTGQLFSLTNSSSLTINGVLISLKGNSIFTLTTNTLGSFGAGNNTLNVQNGLCTGGGCKTVGGFLVAGGGTVELPASGFQAFTTPTGTNLNPNGTTKPVNIGPTDALFFVETNSTLKIVKR